MIPIGYKKSETFLVAYIQKPDQRLTMKAKGMPTLENVGISTSLSLIVEKIGRILYMGKCKAKSYIYLISNYDFFYVILPYIMNFISEAQS